ncbi:MAG: tetratricopeptide repeat protein, partial [Hyphomicrobiales bacterium]
PSPEAGIGACARLIRSGRYSGHGLATAYNNRGYYLAETGDLKGALEDLDRAIKIWPRDATFFLTRGYVLGELGEIDRAFTDTNQAIKLDPKLAQAYVNRSAGWIAKGEPAKALADVEKALRLEPGNIMALHFKGLSLYHMSRYKEAVTAYNAALKADPKLALAYAHRGYSLFELGEYEKAAADFEKQIALDATLTSGYIGRALYWKYKDDTQRALEEINHALKLDTRDTDALNARAILLELLGEHDRAIADIEAAIRIAPEEARLYLVRGNLWRETGNLEQALADQNKAITLNKDPNFPDMNSQRGDTHRYLGNYDEALADYDEALRIRPTLVHAIVGRGLVFEKKGDLAAARKEFERAIATKDVGTTELLSAEERKTAQARLAALDSGAPQPVIPPAPSKTASTTSIPTPQLALPDVDASQKGAGIRVALVIGNSAYENASPLSNPQRDAAAIAETLRKVGFETVTLASDAGRDTLVNALRDFASVAEKADWALVYYAGHGIEVNGINYLIPVDAKLSVDRDVQFEAVPLDQVLASVEQARKLKLVILDACRDNPFVPKMRKTPAPESRTASVSTAGGVVGTRSVGLGLGRIEDKTAGQATLVVYSAKHGQVALDGEGEHSPFAVAFVQRVATPGVEINKVFRLVRDDVMEATAGRQEPYTYGSLPGKEDFFFVSRK